MTRDGLTPVVKIRTSHKKARECQSLPLLERTPRETPYQDYSRIKKMVQAKADLKGELTTSDLFVDSSFPPDRSSLTYVYSGDDKYERTVFRRPKEIKEDPILTGVGGICDEPFPWQLWKQRGWFHAALVVVSLSVRALERLIPGFRNSEQNFDASYVGCFHFHIWRFGEWVDIVVDDYLPILDGFPLFSRPLGSAGEMWGPLVEKAYAKCKRTFQAIEYGFTLDVLTDLTGAICEFFTPDIDPPSNLFHILYKSALNRSLMACWRNNKRLTPAGFNWSDDSGSSDKDRYLHIITAVSKFSVSGGRMEQMIRLKCPYGSEPRWHGRFSDGDTPSWQNVNSEFMSRLQPHSKKDLDEYWMTYSDFRCNFGGLIVISSPEPFRMDGFNIQRTYRTYSDAGLHSTDTWTEGSYRNRARRFTSPNDSFAKQLSKRRTNSDSDCHTNFYVDPASAPCSPSRNDRGKTEHTDAAMRRRLFVAKERDYRAQLCSEAGRQRAGDDDGSNPCSPTRQSRDAGGGAPHPSDSQSCNKHLSSSCLPSPRRRKSTGEKLKDAPGAHSSPGHKTGHAFRKTHKTNFMKKHSLDTTLHGMSLTSPHHSSTDSATGSDQESSGVWASPSGFEPSFSLLSTPADTPDESHASATFSVTPATPGPTTADNSYSTSDVFLKIADDGKRPQSAPNSTGNTKDVSSGSLSSLTQSSFLATRGDYFRSDGKWRVILEHKDIWKRDTPSADRTRLDVHSKTHRVYFLVTRHEVKDPLVTPTLQDKRHVLISLIQDYRHGPSTANSLLVPIGFCLYRTKHCDRDEKRHISKLQLIGQVDGEPDRREVTARFDLDPGGYFLVPYYHADHHQGEFLLRVLSESDVGQVKAGCKIS
ncbi:calpain-3-like [Physella acuta]|uniref:calpain-3-like n=1 Tax=Physella acuta TaxID=109671 RepID=UPI0027DB34E1|nr:calpain-3-like [Physella acuta]